MYERIHANINRRIQLTDAEFEHFKTFLHEKTFKKKEFLLKAGEISRYLSFVNQGCFRTYSMDKTGEEHILQFSLEDWWVGDAYSALTLKPLMCMPLIIKILKNFSPKFPNLSVFSESWPKTVLSPWKNA
jgi:hypothetical protein